MPGCGEEKGCAATFIERQTRLYHATLMSGRSAASMEQAIRTLYANIFGKYFRDLRLIGIRVQLLSYC